MSRGSNGMSIKEFLYVAQDYYGAYSEVAKATVQAWLEKRSPTEREIIWEEVLKILSATYRTPPGIKELEEGYTRALNYRKSELGPAVPQNVPQITSETEEEYMDPEEVKRKITELADAICRRRSTKRGNNDRP